MSVRETRGSIPGLRQVASETYGLHISRTQGTEAFARSAQAPLRPLEGLLSHGLKDLDGRVLDHAWVPGAKKCGAAKGELQPRACKEE